MKEYLLSIIGILLLSSLLLSIIPEGKTASVIKGTTKMACLVVILSPIIGYFSSTVKESRNGEKAGMFFQETVIEEDESFIQYYSEMRIHLAESAIEKELFALYQIEPNVILCWEVSEIQSGFSAENVIKICSIIVQPKDIMEENMKKKVCEYLENKYCSEVLLE